MRFVCPEAAQLLGQQARHSVLTPDTHMFTMPHLRPMLLPVCCFRNKLNMRAVTARVLRLLLLHRCSQQHLHWQLQACR